MKIKAIIIEDEQPARATLKSYLELYFPNVVVEYEIDNVKDAINILAEAKADVLFLDVQLKDGLGIEVLNGISHNKDLKIIFTTAHDEYTYEAFQHKAFGYLLKPIDPIDFKEIMNRALKDILYSDQSAAKIKIPSKRGNISISVFDILRCGSESNYTKFFMRNGEEYIISKTLKFVEKEMLPYDFFIRIHQSHLVNINHVDKDSVTHYSLRMSTGTLLPISRSKKAQLIKKIDELNR